MTEKTSEYSIQRKTPEKQNGAVAEMLSGMIRTETRRILARAADSAYGGLKKTNPNLAEPVLRKLARDTVKVFSDGGFFSDEIIKAVDEKLLGHTDELTGLFKPGRIKEFYEKSIAENESGRASALVAFDLDYFKQVNDTKGHDVGDLLLQNVGKIVKTHLRNNDIGIRKSGDEFIILLSNVTQEDVTNIIARIAGEISAPIAGDVTSPTISVGCVLIHRDDLKKPSFEEAFKIADQAMHISKKERGRLTMISGSQYAKFSLNINKDDGGKKAFSYGEQVNGSVEDFLGSFENARMKVYGALQRVIGEIGQGLGDSAQQRMKEAGVEEFVDLLSRLLYEAQGRNNGK
ncbi:MAG: GGDEF domain-containing protein [Patescibacteria group bacterium]